MKNLPKGHTEEQVLEVMTRVANILAGEFVFGYIEREDAIQEAIIFQMEALASYDNVRPLANFLYVSARNRLTNLKRKICQRYDTPCKCASGHPCNGREFCKKFLEWQGRNTVKKNLLKPFDLGEINDEQEKFAREESDIEENCQERELLALIDGKLDIELRSDWLKLRSGVQIPKARRLAVEEAVRDICGI